MKKLFAALLALLLLSCACAEEMTVEEYPVVDGSTATLPLSYALMSRFTGVSEEEARENIHHSKTSESFDELIYGRADLLLVYEPIADVYDYAAVHDVVLEKKPIGRDALVFLINENNGADALSHDEIVGIYSGEITNWAELGGEDLPIVAYQRIENSGSQVMMVNQVMKDIPLADAPRSQRTSEMAELIDVLASYRNDGNAIGYSVYYYVHNMYMQEGIKLVTVNGTAPDNETIRSGEYPYVQDFYAVIRADEPENSPARRIFDWLTTDEGRQLIEDAGYVALR